MWTKNGLKMNKFQSKRTIKKKKKVCETMSAVLFFFLQFLKFNRTYGAYKVCHHFK